MGVGPRGAAPPGRRGRGQAMWAKGSRASRAEGGERGTDGGRGAGGRKEEEAAATRGESYGEWRLCARSGPKPTATARSSGTRRRGTGRAGRCKARGGMGALRAAREEGARHRVREARRERSPSARAGMRAGGRRRGSARARRDRRPAPDAMRGGAGRRCGAVAGARRGRCGGERAGWRAGEAFGVLAVDARGRQNSRSSVASRDAHRGRPSPLAFRVAAVSNYSARARVGPAARAGSR